mgnify:FL=1
MIRVSPRGLGSADQPPGGTRAPTGAELTAAARAEAAARARAEGRPEVARVIESGDSSSLQATIAGGVAVGAGATAYAACMAPFVAAAVATGGAGAAAPVAAHFLCGAAGSLAGAGAAWLVMSADEAAAWVGDLFDGGDNVAIVSDSATGNIRARHLPASVRPLLLDKTASFRSDSGPFEGEWDLEWVVRGRTSRSRARFYDRDGWVVGPSTSSFAGDFAFRRSGNVATGRYYSNGDNAWYGWILTVEGNRFIGIRPGSPWTISGTLRSGPDRTPVRRDREQRSGEGRASSSRRPAWVVPVVVAGAVAIAGAIGWTLMKRKKR